MTTSKYKPICLSVIAPLKETNRLEFDDLDKKTLRKILHHLKHFSYEEVSAVARYTKYCYLKNPNKTRPFAFYCSRMRGKELKKIAMQVTK